ncbi:MAG: carbohydrate binding domain-containing protein [Bacillota bacterium]|nr:carbohydrate binding domain-containing protein [Bacillota bacterium]
MKKLIMIMVTILLFCFMCIAGYAEGNMLANPSFEDVTGDNPKGWEPWSYASGSTFKVEDGNGHTGKKFVSITSQSENDARYKQTVSVKENSIYKLSCWARTENVGQQKAGAIISILDYVFSSKDLKGTNDKWQYEEMYAKIGPDISSVVVTVSLGGHGNMNTGKAYFDDVSMEEVTSVPSGVEVATISKKQPADNSSTSGDNKSNGSGALIIVIIVVLIVIGISVYIVIVSKKSKKRNTDSDDNQDEEAYDDSDDSSDNDDFDDYE